MCTDHIRMIQLGTPRCRSHQGLHCCWHCYRPCGFPRFVLVVVMVFDRHVQEGPQFVIVLRPLGPVDRQPVPDGQNFWPAVSRGMICWDHLVVSVDNSNSHLYVCIILRILLRNQHSFLIFGP